MTSKFTRRAFVVSAATLPLALRSMAETQSPRWVLLGTDKGPGIFRCSWDGAAGRLGVPELAVKVDHPEFLALHPSLSRLYAVSVAAVVSFHIDVASGGLEFAEQQSSLGDGPCAVSVDRTGRSAFVANYTGGSFAAYPLTADGGLKAPTGSLHCLDNPKCGVHGPAKEDQEASHLHCAVVSPGNDFVLACDMGNDSIEVFPIHPGAANPLGTAQRVAARAGSGPRHLAFHPNGRWVYVVHEIDATIDVYDWSVRDGAAGLRLREGSVVSTLAANTSLTGNTGCEIVVSADGRFVYTCVRGVDELVVYRVDEKMGTLNEQQRISCGGAIPRHFAFDPSQRWLLCANQNGSTVTVFAHDDRNGRLTGPVQTVAADTPMFVQFI